MEVTEYSVDFNDVRIGSFPIRLVKVTWLGHQESPPNVVVTCHLVVFDGCRTIPGQVTLQLFTEAWVGSRLDPLAIRVLEPAVAALCALVRQRLFPS